MSIVVPYEIGPGYKPGGLALVGRDPGEWEEREGRPFCGPAGRLLDDCLREAGIRRADCAILNVVKTRPHGNQFSAHPRAAIEQGVLELRRTLDALGPNLVVALGNEAAYSQVDSWPSRTGDIFGAYGVEERRGYLWSGVGGRKVLTTLHPAAALRAWVPGRMLISYDFQKAKEEAHVRELRRPEREVVVVASDRDAKQNVDILGLERTLAMDIEITNEQQLLCVGFAPSRNRSVVFPARYLEAITSLLRSPVRKIGQNFQFDLHFLLTRYGIRVEGYTDDTILAWHALYPELAGSAVRADGKRKTKMTRKSLAFLASLFTTDEWWKEYDTDEMGMYELNGRDCCITFDIMEQLRPMLNERGVRAIYEHEIALVWPVVEMQARGLRVDEKLRRERIAALTARLSEREAELSELALPILRERADRLSKPHLFRSTPVCKVCHNGKKKRLTCEACGGAGKLERYEFNPGSPEQAKILLYEVLALPKHFKDGKLTTDEEALKQLLAGVQA